VTALRLRDRPVTRTASTRLTGGPRKTRASSSRVRSQDALTRDEYEHQPDERAFVNWLLDEHPELRQIHLHSRRTVRGGLTLLQRSSPLARPAGAAPS
jgi:hypothetical protein